MGYSLWLLCWYFYCLQWIVKVIDGDLMAALGEDEAIS